MNTQFSMAWAAQEAARAFCDAMGKQWRVFRRHLSEGVIVLHVDVIPGADFDETALRLRRAGRMLADEAKRKRLRAFAVPPAPMAARRWARVESQSLGVGLRMTETWLPALDRMVYRLDMYGSRRVPRVPPGQEPMTPKRQERLRKLLTPCSK